MTSSSVPAVEFTIGNAQLDSGLRGFPVGTCWTSQVDPQIGVTYVGYPIAELAYMPPESVIYLLFNKELPSADEARAFAADLAARSAVDALVFDVLRTLPKQGHPMDWLAVGLTLLGMTGKDGDYREDALNMIARVPAVLAAIFRIREGWGDLIDSDPSLGYVENFVHMLGVPGTDEAALAKLLRIYYVLHMDHGGGNLSTFTGKAVASGLADMYQSMVGAMNGLAGPRHGLANQDCFAMVKEVDSEDPAEVEELMRARLARGELIFGFGHAVLRQEDPRAKVEFDVGDELYPDDHWFKVVKALRIGAVNVLKENPKVSNPYPNVDLVSGSLLAAGGLTNPDYYTTLFGWSRIAGIGAQIVDERQSFRNGRGVAIYRPRFIGVNQPPRSVND
ncbi:MAG: citrate (Si)-synthase [Chloroflexota bacterium]|nr:citrate (Si)-synthase [Chloroflexota bacterium]